MNLCSAATGTGEKGRDKKWDLAKTVLMWWLFFCCRWGTPPAPLTGGIILQTCTQTHQIPEATQGIPRNEPPSLAAEEGNDGIFGNWDGLTSCSFSWRGWTPPAPPLVSSASRAPPGEGTDTKPRYQGCKSPLSCTASPGMPLQQGRDNTWSSPTLPLLSSIGISQW